MEDVISSDNVLLLFRCNWGQHACQSEDFHPFPTPIGMCYTFNSGFTGALRVATGTGTYVLQSQ